MTPLLKELNDLIIKIDNQAMAGQISNDDVMYISGFLSGSGLALGKKHDKGKKK